MLERKLAIICTMMSKPHGQFMPATNARGWEWNIGGYFIDHYNGYIVREIHENGAEGSPFGNSRVTAGEMYNILEGITCALYIMQKGVTQ